MIFLRISRKKSSYNLGNPAQQVNLYKYRYNGKEYQDELGLNMYDMDMRQYDPTIARWVVQDPVIHHSMSPYNAFDNNPAFWMDPSGGNANESIGFGSTNYINNGNGIGLSFGEDGSMTFSGSTASGEHSPPDDYKLGKDGQITKISDIGDTDRLFAENGDLIADNIDKSIFNEVESINIQENGLSGVNSESFGSLIDFVFKLSLYTQKEIALGMYGYTDINGNYTPGAEFINVLAYGKNDEGNSTAASNNIGSGTILLASGHTHPSFLPGGGTSNPSGADRNNIKHGNGNFKFIYGRTGTASYFFNYSTNKVNTLIKTNYSQPFTKEYLKNNLGWKKQF